MKQQMSAEQQARDLLERLGHPTAQQLTAGDVVELANLIAHKGGMAKNKKYVKIPLELARLLVAEPDDLKDSTNHREVQAEAKSMLKLLMKTGVPE